MVDWVTDFPTPQPMQLERIMYAKVMKKTCKGVYKEYLIKWEGFAKVEATWMSDWISLSMER